VVLSNFETNQSSLNGKLRLTFFGISIFISEVAISSEEKEKFRVLPDFTNTG
jgi:hypothetical protein